MPEPKHAVIPGLRVAQSPEPMTTRAGRMRASEPHLGAVVCMGSGLGPFGPLRNDGSRENVAPS